MDKSVNILSLVSYKIFPADMGGQKGIAFFNRYLSRHINLCCVTTQENSRFTEEGYPIKNILSNSAVRYINPLYFFTLKKIIQEEKITHLIVEHPYYGWLGILLKWFCKVRLIVHSHNIESLRFKTMSKWWWGILWHYEKHVHKNADYNFFIQEDDRRYAVDNFKLNPETCTVITYGFELSEAPSPLVKQAAKEALRKLHGIAEDDKILLFNGTLNYKPNLAGLNIILEQINPSLLKAKGFKYKIVICGNKLPANYLGLVQYKEKNIIYAGFVDDINLYFKGADIFINPVIDGGGIKTKVVEALGYNLSVLSTASGAVGVPPAITGGKLEILPNNNWDLFAQRIMLLNTEINIHPAYFDHFYWDNIAKKAADAMKFIKN